MATKPHTGPWHVYALRDPRDHAVRYVGVTRSTLRQRLIGHYSAPDWYDDGKTRWMNELKALGFRPTIEAVETITGQPYSHALSLSKEAYWIEKFLGDGTDLLNQHNRAWLLLPVDHPGRKLRSLIRDRGLSEPKAAEEIGVSAGELGRWCNGVERPSDRNRGRIEAWSHRHIRVPDWGPPTKTGPKPGSSRRRLLLTTP